MPKGRLGYAYTNTRVRAMRSKLFKPGDFERMLKMSVPEIARLMSDTEYRQEIDELGVNYSGVNLIEYALNRNMANTFRRIHNFAIKDSRDAITAYLKRWDVWNIKTILRGKRANAGNDEILVALVPAGTLKPAFLREIVEKAASYDGAIEMLNGTEYAPILKKHKDKPEVMEDMLDRSHYAALPAEMPEEVMPFVQRQIDVLNELGSARAKDTELDFIPIPGGSAKFRPPKAQTTEELTAQLTKALMLSGTKMLHDFRRNLRPVIGYFTAKETEVRNIRLIARAKHAELPAEYVEKNLVV